MANISDNSMGDKKANGLSIAFGIFKAIIRLLFPSFVLFQMNKNLSRVNRFYKNPWFSKQVKLNWIVIAVLTALFIGPLSLGYLAISGNKNFNRKIEAAKITIKNREVKKTITYISSAMSDDLFLMELKIFGGLALFGMVFGNLIVRSHDLVRDSNKLIKILRTEGVIDREAKNPTVLYTPVGILVDLAGSHPKEVAQNERIWMAMNIEVKDWAEAPEKRSLVFFKTTFKLKPRYDFVFEQKKQK